MNRMYSIIFKKRFGNKWHEYNLFEQRREANVLILFDFFGLQKNKIYVKLKIMC